MHPTVSATLADTVEAAIEGDGVSRIGLYPSLSFRVKIVVENVMIAITGAGTARVRVSHRLRRSWA
jgi:hypothetical protein